MRSCSRPDQSRGAICTSSAVRPGTPEGDTGYDIAVGRIPLQMKKGVFKGIAIGSIIGHR
jgi:hypothetical protein